MMKSERYQQLKVMIIQQDYTSLLDYAYFKDNYRLIEVDLSKQKALDADPRSIQEIVFQGVVGGNGGTKIRLYTILEQSKETVLEFTKEQQKFCN